MNSEGQQTYRRVTLTHLPPGNLYTVITFICFYIEKLILKLKFWSNPKDFIWQKSWVYLCFSILGIQKCQRCSKIPIECLCMIHKMYHSLGFFKNLFLHVLHTSVLLF